MQEIKAYIREQMLDQVIDALASIPGLPGVAVVDVREYGHAVADSSLVKTKMVKLELDLPDDLVAPVMEAIINHARTEHGHPGDGKIFVTPLGDAVRIADGERGESAVSR